MRLSPFRSEGSCLLIRRMPITFGSNCRKIAISLILRPVSKASDVKEIERSRNLSAIAWFRQLTDPNIDGVITRPPMLPERTELRPVRRQDRVRDLGQSTTPIQVLRDTYRQPYQLGKVDRGLHK
jgi:hypothetical protein